MRTASPPLPRRRLHQATFVLAGAYNILWGAYAVADPGWLFRLADIDGDADAEPFIACLGMVLGLYGLLYLAVARWPERGWLIAAVGLAGKVLGPIGLAYLVASGEWPPRTIIIIVGNDLIWWIPFALYLRDAWPLFRADWSGARQA